jgi:hypothetical protein
LALNDLAYEVTYEVISSDPAISVTSAIHSIRLRPCTFDSTTLIEWTTDFSNDATQEVIQDSKFKKLEAFEDLFQAVAKKRPGIAEAPKSPVKKAKK